MNDGTPYVAAFRNADGTIRRTRFRTTWTEPLDVRIEAARVFGIQPCELSEAMTGNVIWKERSLQDA